MGEFVVGSQRKKSRAVVRCHDGRGIEMGEVSPRTWMRTDHLGDERELSGYDSVFFVREQVREKIPVFSLPPPKAKLEIRLFYASTRRMDKLSRLGNDLACSPEMVQDECGKLGSGTRVLKARQGQAVAFAKPFASLLESSGAFVDYSSHTSVEKPWNPESESGAEDNITCDVL